MTSSKPVGGDVFFKWINNKEPYIKSGITSKSGLGGGYKVSMFSYQTNSVVNLWSTKASQVIYSKGRSTFNKIKISNISVGKGFVGFEYERDWTNGVNTFALDLGPIHFETGNYPVLRVFSLSFQTGGGFGVDVDLNLGRLIHDMGDANLYFYKNNVKPSTLYGF